MLMSDFQNLLRMEAGYQWSQPSDVCVCVCVHAHTCAHKLSCFSHAQLFATPWTVAPQPPLSMGFSRQEYCSGLPCTPPEDLPDPGIKPSD